MKLKQWKALAVLLFLVRPASAAEHRLEKLAEPAPAEVAEKIASQLAPEGVRVIRGKSRAVCDLWLCKELAVKADFSPTTEVNYPLEVGQLVGAARYKSKGTDFRGQEVPPGVYVVRYALQPVDGNHAGTSITRDFLLLTPAAEDTEPAPMEQKALFKLSVKAAGRKHPTMLSLLAPGGDAAERPAIRHQEDRDLWIAQLSGNVQGKSDPLALDLVVVGQAEH